MPHSTVAPLVRPGYAPRRRAQRVAMVRNAATLPPAA
jgi:hypothetical protein